LLCQVAGKDIQQAHCGAELSLGNHGGMEESF
jgi:hypothetical protein